MNRRTFLNTSIAAGAAGPLRAFAAPFMPATPDATSAPTLAVMLVDTDRASAPIDKRIYGQFLEHINHSIEDGLFAEQIRGAGFEGKDYATYWQPVTDHGSVSLVEVPFHRGTQSVRLEPKGGSAGVRQGRVFVERNVRYDGFAWLRAEAGSARVSLRVTGANGSTLADVALPLHGTEWSEVPFAFTSTVRDTQAAVAVVAEGTGTVLLDFVSLMRADARSNDSLRPDLFASLQALQPTFIRWPGGSYASTYRWQECIGPYPKRGYHPNMYWGGYSGYGGFGTDEFLRMCKLLGTEPLICLACPDTKPASVQYAMDWVRYVNDPPTTPMGKLRAANGHPEPYNVSLFQIDNEPMNNGFTPASYAEIVRVYGAELRKVAPGAKIVACGQKRSTDMEWSETVIDLAGQYFDILGCHNYEYEPDNYASGIVRLRDYLTKLCAYVRTSKHPRIEVAVLEWSLQHTYDWRAGLHAAGSLMMYEELSPGLTMTCPALLMRNTTDDPKWTSSVYHDHVTWFPGGSYPVEKLFREHYAEHYLASAVGTFHDVPDRTALLDKISTAIPTEWRAGTVDAVATRSADGKRIVLKAVNYQPHSNTLLTRLLGKALPQHATVTVHTISAAPDTVATLEHPDAYPVQTRTMPFTRDLAIDLEPYSVAVVELVAG